MRWRAAWVVMLVGSLVADRPALGRAPRPSPRRAEWWMARHAALSQAPGRRQAQLVFLGDSITAGWLGPGLPVWRRRFERLPALNLAISGDRIQHLLWRLQHGAVDGLAPRLLVLLIGINDLAFYPTFVRDVADGILATVAELRRRLPGARVLLLGLLPSGPRPGPLRERIARVNRFLAGGVDGRMVCYLDVGQRLLGPDGALARELSADHLHLSEKAYALVAEAMAPAILKLLAR